MAGDILSIGKSALFAAQAGLSTTGHNISNANVAGYHRQQVVQASATAMNYGYGFVGTGTQISDIKRYSDDFLNGQVRTAQASKSALDAYAAQIKQIDNVMADTTSGLSPALQDFFKALQDVTGNHASDQSRQSLLSSAQSLASRFQALDGRLQEIRDGVNSKITSNVAQINTYADQIAQLNDQIGSYASGDRRAPNDLMDKREQLVMELNQQIKATVMPGDNNSLTVSIGNGQPLVVGKQAFALATTTSATDLTRVEVGYATGRKVTVLPESALAGGELGGVLDFRATTLDAAQNSLGRIAVGLASTFNSQHRLGLDAAGLAGGDFFTQAGAVVTANINNNGASTTAVSASISDPTQLTTSDYKVDYDGTNVNVIRLSDNRKTAIAPYPQSAPQTIDGIDFTISGNAAAGDNFLVRPTANGARAFNVALTSVSQIAAAAPIATSVPTSNTGTATISSGSVDQAYLSNPLGAPLTLSFSSNPGGTLSGFPASQAVTVTNGASSTAYPAGSPVPYTMNATYSFGGISVALGGVPGDGDQFTIAPNSGTGDVRNAGLLGDLQTSTIFNGGSATYQSAYAQLVSLVGNKTREVQVNASAGEALLAQASGAAQDVSGVNLDEEATNLLKYQQAYQAAGKVMQIASTVFDTLLSIGH
jgi:flagellar hook-associated protein 1 FlgK